jgi:ParB family transcriptional regulator, chromosome partitioning protein
MALGKSLGNILENYFGEDNLAINSVNLQNLNINEVAIADIQNNPFQTRTHFDQEKIEFLAKDIEKHGLIQPIVVLRKSSQPIKYLESGGADTYILLAGERRLRACKLLGWQTIPVVIRDSNTLSEKQQSLLSVMENLQREDLSSIELAGTFQMLMKTQELTEIELADLLKKSVQYVKNYLRLITLTDQVKVFLQEKKLTEGQARYLVPLEADLQVKMAKIIIEKELSVKEVIVLIKKYEKENNQNMTNTEKKSIKNNEVTVPQEYVKRASKLCEFIPKSQVKYLGNEQKGKIIISW